jgi:hypothetical protein
MKASDKLNFGIVGVGGLWVWNGTSLVPLSGAGTLTAGSWQHLALVWDSGQVTAYLDGVVQQRTSCLRKRQRRPPDP